MNLSSIDESITTNGWAVLDAPNPEPLRMVKKEILAKLKELSGSDDIELETYHEFYKDDDQHFTTQKKITDFARQSGFARQVILDNLQPFQDMLGPDICGTRINTWRIARPSKTQDAFGYHRDTDYGHSAFELNLWIPLVDMDDKTALRLMSGSHIRPFQDFPYEKVEHPTIRKGDFMNQLGFRYAPKIYDPWFEKEMVPASVNFGQILIFSSSMMHGQMVNEGTVTRWSFDFSVANALASINRVMEFDVLSSSPLTKIGRTYHSIQW